MKNKPYDLYELPLISDLKDMIIQKRDQKPNQIAFSFTKGRNTVVKKTYRDFFDEVVAMGTWICEQNLEGKHVAIIGENSYEWLVCFFAIVCSGGVAVPIDKELPAEEIKNLLLTADVQAMIYSKSYKVVAENSVEKLSQFLNRTDTFDIYPMANMEQYLNKGNELLESGHREFVDKKIDRKQMCCIIFTSGTSGKSKGVMLSNENIAEDINRSCQLFKLDGNTMAVLPFHHAFGLVVAVFMAFQYGYTIFINRSIKSIQKDFQIAKPQTIFLVPLFVETFYKQIWTAARKNGKEKILIKMMKISDMLLNIGIDLRRFWFSDLLSNFGGNLEYIICGGASLNTRYIDSFRSWGIEVLNGFGTTECSPCAAVNRNHYHKDGSVGIAVPGIQVKTEEDGEILIKGPIVMIGYYKDNHATNEVLNDGWYSTGDLGTIDKEGFLTLTGRKKNLIILSNGENISPEELESDFLKFEAVQEVLVREKNQKIVAEIFPSADYIIENVQTGNIQEYFDDIRKKVNDDRPLYKQVSEVILRDSEFPKNTSKKILRY